ncbi:MULTISPECIES: DUF6345 domain-containing protein [Micromonospora]|uniref:DUF6345 domain-containing protein n=1 Tax=Micromonospora TaxID=1873 RepID=UPI000C87EF35|nr:DUF6345 domain-containing protein [Verrucosispora sp. ts21]PMR60335.1 hypothetical protein C1A38_14835 [Verrucosispora sp. ts21]
MSYLRSRGRWWRLGFGLAVAGTTGAATLAASGAPVSAAATTELLTYQVRATGISEAQAAELGEAFGIKRLSRSEDGSVRFADEKGFLDIPSISVGDTGKDEDGNPTVGSILDKAALARLRPIDAEKALGLTREALARVGLYPEEARPTVGHTSLEMVDAKGKPTVSAALDTTVSFSFSLDGLPYEGPGAKIRVGFGSDGEVTQLSYSTRVLEKGEPVRVLDPEAGRERCAKAMQGAVRIRQADYAYPAPALDAKVDRIEPSFRCSGVNADGSAAQIIFVPAAVDAELPEIDPVPVPPRRPVTATAFAAPGVQSLGVVDVGSEGTGPCSGLPWTGTNLASFNGQFTSRGIPVEFSWLNGSAWERDFKDPAFGGTDSNWTDHVDMTYWQGHGAPTGFSFSGCSSRDDTFLANTEARWGNGDVEWMSLFTCLVLANDSGGQRWWQRWGGAFDGLHQINSFHTVSYHSASHGGTFANYMLRSPFLWWNNPMPVRKAWAQASIDDQPASVVWATMGPVGPGGLVNFDDYFWGKGSVGPDVPASSLTGWWYISGTS